MPVDIKNPLVLNPDEVFPPGFGESFTRGVSGGVDVIKGGAGEVTAAVGRLTDIDVLQRLGQDITNKAAASQAESAVPTQRIEDVSSVNDFLQYAGYNIGQQVPILASLALTRGAGGVITRLAGGSAKAIGRGKVAGLLAGDLPLQFAEGKADLREAGVSEAESDIGAFTAAIPRTALDALPTELLFRRFGIKPGQGITRRVGTLGATVGVAESLTEVGQEGVGAITRSIYDETFDITGEEAQSRYLNAAAAAFISGGAFGSIGGIPSVIDSTAERVDDVAGIEDQTPRTNVQEQLALEGIEGTEGLPPLLTDEVEDDLSPVQGDFFGEPEVDTIQQQLDFEEPVGIDPQRDLFVPEDQVVRPRARTPADPAVGPSPQTTELALTEQPVTSPEVEEIQRTSDPLSTAADARVGRRILVSGDPQQRIFEVDPETSLQPTDGGLSLREVRTGNRITVPAQQIGLLEQESTVQDFDDRADVLEQRLNTETIEEDTITAEDIQIAQQVASRELGSESVINSIADLQGQPISAVNADRSNITQAHRAGLNALRTRTQQRRQGVEQEVTRLRQRAQETEADQFTLEPEQAVGAGGVLEGTQRTFDLTPVEAQRRADTDPRQAVLKLEPLSLERKITSARGVSTSLSLPKPKVEDKATIVIRKMIDSFNEVLGNAESYTVIDSGTFFTAKAQAKLRKLNADINKTIAALNTKLAGKGKPRVGFGKRWVGDISKAVGISQIHSFESSLSRNVFNRRFADDNKTVEEHIFDGIGVDVEAQFVEQIGNRSNYEADQNVGVLTETGARRIAKIIALHTSYEGLIQAGEKKLSKADKALVERLALQLEAEPELRATFFRDVQAKAEQDLQYVLNTPVYHTEDVGPAAWFQDYRDSQFSDLSNYDISSAGADAEAIERAQEILRGVTRIKDNEGSYREFRSSSIDGRIENTISVGNYVGRNVFTRQAKVDLYNLLHQVEQLDGIAITIKPDVVARLNKIAEVPAASVDVTSLNGDALKAVRAILERSPKFKAIPESKERVKISAALIAYRTELADTAPDDATEIDYQLEEGSLDVPVYKAVYFNPIKAQYANAQLKFYDYNNARHQAYTQSDALGSYFDDRQAHVDDPTSIGYRYVIAQPNEVLNSYIEDAQAPAADEQTEYLSSLAVKEIMLRKLVSNLEIPPSFPIEFIQYADARAAALRSQTGELYADIILRPSDQLQGLVDSADAVLDDVVAGQNLDLIEASAARAELAQRELDLRAIVPQFGTNVGAQYTKEYLRLEARMYYSAKELRKRVRGGTAETTVTAEYAQAQKAEFDAQQAYEAARETVADVRGQLQNVQALDAADDAAAKVVRDNVVARRRLTAKVQRALRDGRAAVQQRNVYQKKFDERAASAPEAARLAVDPTRGSLTDAQAEAKGVNPSDLKLLNQLDNAVAREIKKSTSALSRLNTAQAELDTLQAEIDSKLSSVKTRDTLQAELNEAQGVLDQTQSAYDAAIETSQELKSTYSKETRTNSLDAAKDVLRKAENDYNELRANPAPFKAKITRTRNVAIVQREAVVQTRKNLEAQRRDVNKRIRRQSNLIADKSTLAPSSELNQEIAEHELSLNTLDGEKAAVLTALEAVEIEATEAQSNLVQLSKDSGKSYEAALLEAREAVTAASKNLDRARSQLSATLTDTEKAASFDEFSNELSDAALLAGVDLEETVGDPNTVSLDALREAEFAREEQQIQNAIDDEYNSLTATADELGIGSDVLQDNIVKANAVVQLIEKQLGVGRVDIITPASAKTAGSYNPVKSIVSVAMDAAHELSVAAHEAYHAAYFKILTKQERAVVNNAFGKGKPMRAKLEAIIQTTQSVEDAEAIIDSMDATPTETQAYAYQFWSKGDLQTTGTLANVFATIKRFFERVKNLLVGNGFQSADDVFDALDSGAMASRKTVTNNNAVNEAVAETAGNIINNIPTETLYSQTGTVNAVNPDLQDVANAAAAELSKSHLKNYLSGFSDTINKGDLLDRAQRAYSKTFASMQHVVRNSPSARKSFDVIKQMIARRDTIVSEQSTVLFDFADGGGFKFLKGRNGVSELTRKRVSDALFDGTTQGKVWDDTYLKENYGMTPDQIGWYRKIRTSVDTLLDLNYNEQARKAREQGNDASAASLLSQLAKLKQEGYFPKKRYGKHSVVVTTPGIGGETVQLAFHLAETPAEQAAIYKTYQKSFENVADVEVSKGYQNKEVLIDHSIEFNAFIDRLAIYEKQGLKVPEPIKRAIYNDMTDSINQLSSLNRKNITGESRDVIRVLADFINQQASAITSFELSASLDESIATGRWAEESQGSFFKEQTIDTVNFIRGNGLEEDVAGDIGGTLRAGAALAYLGGNISHAIIQMSQLVMASAPFFSSIAPLSSTYAALGKGLKDTANFKFRDIALLQQAVKRGKGIDNLSAEEVEHLLRASEDGTVQAQQIFAVSGIARGKLLARSSKARRAADIWMSPFVRSEELNRRTTLLAAIRLGNQLKVAGKPLTSPTTPDLTFDNIYDFAKHAVEETQFIYNRANRPRFARSDIGAILFTFKSYPVFMVELFKALPKQGRITMLSTIILASGTSGLFFSDDLFDLIDTLTQLTGLGPADTKREVNKFVDSLGESINVDDLGDLLSHGILNPVLAQVPGFGGGVDIGGRLGLGNIIPGTDILQAGTDLGQSLSEVAGPVGALVSGSFAATGQAARGNIEGAFDKLPVSGIRNAVQAGSWIADDYTARNTSGAKVSDVEGWEVLWKAVGFSPLEINKQYELDKQIAKSQSYIGSVNKDFRRELVEATNRRDFGKVRELYSSIEDWNNAHPEPQYQLNVSRASIRRAVKQSNKAPVERRLEGLSKRNREGFTDEVSDLLESFEQ